MKLFEIKSGYHVSYFLHNNPPNPPEIQDPVGAFSSLEEAVDGIKRHFANSQMKQLMQYKQDEDYAEIKQDIEHSIDEAKGWSPREFIGNGGQMWDVGSGDYAYVIRKGQYPSVHDIMEPTGTGTLQ